MRYRIKQTAILFSNIVIFLLKSIRGKEKLSKEKIKKILIIELFTLGDIVMLSPFIDKLKAHFKNAQIDLEVALSTFDLFKNIPSLTSLVVSQDIRGWLQNLRKIRQNRYDLVIVPNYGVRNVITALLSKGTYLSGYLRANFLKARYNVDSEVETLGLKLEKSLCYKSEEHIITKGLKILQALGIEVAKERYRPQITIRENIRTKVALNLRHHSVSEKDFSVLIHPGASHPLKRWPEERFAEVADKIIKELKGKVIIVGSFQDENIIVRIKNLMKEKPSLIQKTDLEEFIALAGGVKLFVGNDSGPVHIAAALKTPLIALFGPALPQHSGPLSKGNIIIFKKVDCCPCDQQRCFKSEEERCMNLISVEEVMQAVRKIQTELRRS